MSEWIDLLSLANMTPKHNLAGTAPPSSATDDVTLGYGVGSRWTDGTNDKDYVCTDATDGAAVWVETTSTAGVHGIDAHSDVDTTTSAPTAGQALVWESPNWVPGSVAAEGGGGSGDAVAVEAGFYTEGGTAWWEVPTSDTWYDAPLDVTEIETNSAILDHDGSSNTGRITVGADGYYLVYYTCAMNDHYGLGLRVRKNGTDTIPTSEGQNNQQTGNDDAGMISWQGVHWFDEDDYIYLQAWWPSAQGPQSSINRDQVSLGVVKLPSAAGAQNFIELGDVPTDYTGKASSILRVNAAEDALVYAPSPVGVTSAGQLSAAQLSSVGNLTVGDTTVIAEVSAPLTPGGIAGQGQIYVKDDAPCTLKFVDDDGTEFDLGSGGAHAAGDGSDHADVATNTTHRGSDGADHSKVTANESAIAALGTAAAEDVGTAIDELVQLENVGGNPGMPAVDGSQLTGVAGLAHGLGSAQHSVDTFENLQTKVGNATLLKLPVTPSQLEPGATTPDGTKVYWGDGTWDVPPGGSTALTGSTGLGQFTYTASAAGAGEFHPDDTVVADTTSLQFHFTGTAAVGAVPDALLHTILVGDYIYMQSQDPSAAAAVLLVTGISEFSPNILFDVTPESGEVGANWLSEDYTLVKVSGGTAYSNTVGAASYDPGASAPTGTYTQAMASVTPVSLGWYTAEFDGMFVHDSATETVSFEIAKDGTQIAFSERVITSAGAGVATPIHIGPIKAEQTSGTHVWMVRWKSSATSADLVHHAFTLTKVSANF